MSRARGSAVSHSKRGILFAFGGAATLLIAFGLAVHSPRANAQEIDLNDPEVSGTARSVFDRSPDLPDGVAFWSNLNALSHFGATDRELVVAWLKGDMGLSTSEAEPLLDLLLSALDSVNRDHDDFKHEIACDPDKPRAVGEDIYPILEAMDDARTEIASDHLTRVKAEMEPEPAARLQQWVDFSKLSIVHTSVRHKEHYRQTGANPNEVLYGICNAVAVSREAADK